MEFNQKIISMGHSLGITIPATIVEFMGLQKEGWLKVNIEMIKIKEVDQDAKPKE